MDIEDVRRKWQQYNDSLQLLIDRWNDTHPYHQFPDENLPESPIIGFICWVLSYAQSTGEIPGGETRPSEPLSNIRALLDARGIAPTELNGIQCFKGVQYYALGADPPILSGKDLTGLRIWALGLTRNMHPHILTDTEIDDALTSADTDTSLADITQQRIMANRKLLASMRVVIDALCCPPDEPRRGRFSF